MFKNAKVFQFELAGKTIVIETGHVARQANGAVTVSCGGTTVLVTATMSRNPREGIDFFPLLVDYEPRMYAVGRIPGSFLRKEGRASDLAILSGRLIDRGIRPLFAEGFRNDVQVVVMTLSSDQEEAPDALALLGAGVALTISDIPFDGPFAGVRVGLEGGEWVLNPTYQEAESGDLDLVVAGTRDAIMMVEAGAKQLPEEDILEGLAVAHETIRQLCDWIEEIRVKVGKPKLVVPLVEASPALTAEVARVGEAKMKQALTIKDKLEMYAAVDKLKGELVAELKALDPSSPVAAHLARRPGDARAAVDELERQVLRTMITKQKVRVDGRALEEIRDLSARPGPLNRQHGSALFRRGNTQVLSILTLGSSGDAQKMDVIEPVESKRYMHQYNFPGFSVGEVKPNRGASRREVGHGALAERALLPVLPTMEEFPYVLRVVSEVLESNGSTSMASTCASSLALMDGGVPLKAPVAGIAMGLIKEGADFAVLTDILGIEDHLGDMDFKVAGTEAGITALQMDIKIRGIDLPIIEKAIAQAREARMAILKVMTEALPAPRPELNPNAPRIIILKIPVDKIGELIGPGGKNIKKLIEETKAKVDVEDDGRVYITASDPDAIAKARSWVERITREVEPGGVYRGKVTRILNFGAFVEIFPGREGLVHISQLAEDRVARVEDVVKVGDELVVKVVEVDAQGRINLSHKAVPADELARLQPVAT